MSEIRLENTILTHNDIAHLPPEEMARLWNEGKIGHLVTNFEVKRDKSGETCSVFYSPLAFPFDTSDELCSRFELLRND